MAVAIQEALQECAIAIVEMIKSQAKVNHLVSGTGGKVRLTESQYDMVKYNWLSSLGDFTHMMGAEIVIVDEAKNVTVNISSDGMTLSGFDPESIKKAFGV